MPKRNPGQPEVIDVDIHDVIRCIVKRRWTVILTALLCLTVVFCQLLLSTPIHRASSRIMVDSKPPRILKVENVVLPDYTDQNNFFNSQVEILKSHSLIRMVEKELGEYNPWYTRGKRAVFMPEASSRERLNSLLKHIRITPVRTTQVIEVSVEDPDPGQAARIANIWTMAYIHFSSIDQLIQRRSDLENELSQQLKYLKEKHPVILGIRNEIDLIDTKINEERERLDRQDENTAAAITRNGDVTNIKVLDFAQPPLKAERPRWLVDLVLAFVIGVFAGLLLALLLEFLDQTIKTSADLEQLVKMTCLATIPNVKITGSDKSIDLEFISQLRLKSLFTESFRNLRTSITYADPAVPSKVIMITSASAGEGKTLSVVNLGLVFAQAGEKTLLIDADMRDPRLQKVFQTGKVGGLTAVLGGDMADVRTFILKSGIRNLDVLVCGDVPVNPAELLASRRFEELVRSVKQDYDRVIIDSPPLLAATDALIVSVKVDSTILIVRAGFAHRHAVVSAVKSLRSVKARILAVALNRVDFYSFGHHYGYSLYEPNTRAKMTEKGGVSRWGMFKKVLKN